MHDRRLETAEISRVCVCVFFFKLRKRMRVSDFDDAKK